MLHALTELRQSTIQGTGLFSTGLIRKGEVVWWETPEDRAQQWDVAIAELKTWPEEQQHQFERYAYQISEDTYTGRKDGVPIDAADFTNHSCDPTTWFVNDTTMTARRDILPGEEITYDYATSETDEDFILACGCGSPNCRRIIRGTDHLLPQVQQAYGSHMMQHVLRKIHKHQAMPLETPTLEPK
ncbi:MAG: SET domain-containing protein [bacterium]